MRYFFTPIERNSTLFLLTVFFIVIFPVFIAIRAQTPGDEQNLKNSETNESTPALFMVPEGSAVVTSHIADGAGYTVRIVNISQFHTIWTNSANYSPNFISSPAQMPFFQGWGTAEFQGQPMRGLAIRKDGTRIYAAAGNYIPPQGGYPCLNSIPNVYRIGPVNAVPTFLATLSGGTAATYKGIGSIDLDETHNLIFASNLDDGKIYSINAATGLPFDVFDPLTPDTSGANLPPYGERVIAVAYNRKERRVYYSIWGYNVSQSNLLSNTIRSVSLYPNGKFYPPGDLLEVTLPNLSRAPAGDIDFRDDNQKMMVAEEPLTETGGCIKLNAHNGRALQYDRQIDTLTLEAERPLDSGKWLLNSAAFEVGRYSSRTNTRGGVAWVNTDLSSSNEEFVLFTGDALRLEFPSFPLPLLAVYGLQFTPSTGGSAGGGSINSNSLIADLDYGTDAIDKWVYHDVDIRNVRLSTVDPGVRGKVTIRATGQAIPYVRLVMVDESGNAATALTNPFGYFSFPAVPFGQTVTVSVSSKHYTFTEPSVTITVDGDIENLDFEADGKQ